MKWNLREVRRQLVHLSGLIVVFVAFFLGNNLTGFLSILFAILIFFLSYYLEVRNEIRKKIPLRIKKIEELEDRAYDLINSMVREKCEWRYMGAILFFLASGISLLLFPRKIAFISITVLAVGDSFSTIIGVHFGKHKTKINPPKSWEGTLGGIATSFLACLAFTNLIAAFVASVVGMTAELLPIRINDNLLIPISTGIALWILSIGGFTV